jgi:hypothetical protein
MDFHVVVDLIEEFLLNFFEHLDEQLIMNQQILIQVHEDFQQLVQLHLL